MAGDSYGGSATQHLDEESLIAVLMHEWQGGHLIGWSWSAWSGPFAALDRDPAGFSPRGNFRDSVASLN